MAKSNTKTKATASCCDQPKQSSSSPNKANAPSPDSPNNQESLSFRLPSISPVLSALLHSSCCWLPALLDLTSIGSASVASISHLKPIFSAITVWVLMDSFRRQGVTSRNLLRALVSVLILLLPMALAYFQPAAPAEAPKHSCH
ncbi:hypothetical protein GMDG_05843 [Pseudogymnoascus destructans 20631-21]|uniref:Uncharacterized protein n=2 Tax=Pseudogymnoascus destructans TaxID=655981 RepID=L8FR89_PSED2|nr:hypothetical protein GMDG_05843 [Pseudogymnoascus destructans 20631-21]